MNKREISPKISEIRSILIGWVRYEGLYCVAAENLTDVAFSGTNNGATSARVFGVAEKETEYCSPSDCKYKIEDLYKEISSKTKKKFLYKFQLVYLLSEPYSLVYFIRPLLSNPVIVTLLPEKNVIHAGLYTAKGVFAGAHLRNMNKLVGKLLPDTCKETSLNKNVKKDKKHEKK